MAFLFPDNPFIEKSKYSMFYVMGFINCNFKPSNREIDWPDIKKLIRIK